MIARAEEFSAGRLRLENECPVRGLYQRDTDRIIHSKSFRRLMYKTQVFLCPEGDHYRTRLTHALEVSRISRTVSRALNLNEDLTEAIALGHDLGHTPFGHAGEDALNEMLSGGFKHNEQSLRLVDMLERNGAGLNLTYETRNGLLCHSGDKKPSTHEGEVVRICDRIAYLNHDMDDAVRADILTEDDLPDNIKQILGTSYTQRIDTLVRDMIAAGEKTQCVVMSETVAAAMDELRAFMFESVYKNPVAKSEEIKAVDIIKRMFEHFSKNPGLMPLEAQSLVERDGTERSAADYIAGMTDRYCREIAQTLFIPHGWRKN